MNVITPKPLRKGDLIAIIPTARAINAEELKDYEAASGFYQTIKDDYVAYAQKKSIDKYLARATSKK